MSARSGPLRYRCRGRRSPASCSPVSSPSNTSTFSAFLAGPVDFGMADRPCCTCQRSISCAGVPPCALAISPMPGSCRVLVCLPSRENVMPPNGEHAGDGMGARRRRPARRAGRSTDVHLDLVHGRYDRRRVEQRGGVVDHEVVDPDGADLAVGEQRPGRLCSIAELIRPVCRRAGRHLWAVAGLGLATADHGPSANARSAAIFPAALAATPCSRMPTRFDLVTGSPDCSSVPILVLWAVPPSGPAGSAGAGRGRWERSEIRGGGGVPVCGACREG